MRHASGSHVAMTVRPRCYLTDLTSARALNCLKTCALRSAQDPELPPSAEDRCAVAGRWLSQAAAEARATVAELLHMGRNPLMNAAVIATAPLVLLMHATMPALTNSAPFAACVLVCDVLTCTGL